MRTALIAFCWLFTVGFCAVQVQACSGAQKAAEVKCGAAEVAAVTAVLENPALTTAQKLAALAVIGAETVACVVNACSPGSGSGSCAVPAFPKQGSGSGSQAP